MHHGSEMAMAGRELDPRPVSERGEEWKWQRVTSRVSRSRGSDWLGTRGWTSGVGKMLAGKFAGRCRDVTADRSSMLDRPTPHMETRLHGN